jgi:hypothetical protein
MILADFINIEWDMVRLKPDRAGYYFSLNWLFEIACIKILRGEYIVQLDMGQDIDYFISFVAFKLWKILV